MEFENASPASLLALQVYHPSRRFDVLDNTRMDWLEKFLITKSGGSSPLSNVHDIAGQGTHLAVQLIVVGLPSGTVWCLGYISTSGQANSKIEIIYIEHFMPR